MLGTVYIHVTCYAWGIFPRSVEQEIVKPTRTFLLLPVNRVKLSSPEFLQILELAARCPMRAAFFGSKERLAYGGSVQGDSPFARIHSLRRDVIIREIEQAIRKRSRSAKLFPITREASTLAPIPISTSNSSLPLALTLTPIARFRDFLSAIISLSTSVGGNKPSARYPRYYYYRCRHECAAT